MQSLLDYLGTAIYVLLALIALYGIYSVIVLVRRIAQKRFASDKRADEFLDEVRDLLRERNFEGVVALCDSQAYWAKAVPQLVLVAMDNRDRKGVKLRRTVSESFEREILSDLEYRTSWIATVVKTAPMIGLLGTVVGMINAFAKIAGASQQGIAPAALASDISFALLTTAMGLTVAIPLVLAGAMIHVRIGKLQDAVQKQLGDFFDDYEAATVGVATRGGAES